MSKNTAPSKDVRTLGIILRRTNYGEADRILNILTPNGKLTAMAKGVRKVRSKLAGGVEMFALIDFNIHMGRGEMGTVTGARMVRYYDGIIKDFERMELMGLILKKVNKAAESADNPEYFKIVEQCMEGLSNDTNVALVKGWFLLNLARAMGEEVNLYRDTEGDKLVVERDYNWDVINEAFAASGDGEYGVDEIKMLRLMMTADLSMVRRVKVPVEMYVKLFEVVRVAVHI